MGLCVLYARILSPHGISNIRLPVDVFDVFEATQHTLEHDSKHGRGPPPPCGGLMHVAPQKCVTGVQTKPAGPPRRLLGRSSGCAALADCMLLNAVQNNSTVSPPPPKKSKLKRETKQRQQMQMGW